MNDQIPTTADPLGELKQRAIDLGDKAAQKLLWAFAGRISDKTIPFLNRSETDGFMEGSGYFLNAPAKDARWRAGFAKHSVVPEYYDGDLYLGGYLAFPPNKAAGNLNDQLVRAFAFDDGSGRGIHVFAVIDCVGISNTDVRAVRVRLKDLIGEKNIVSVNVSATHCHSAADTLGVWGDLPQALKKNRSAVKSKKKLKDAVSGRNPDYMAYLIEMTAETVQAAVDGMAPGTLEYALLDGTEFVHDKRPPYVTDPYITVLRFTPDNKEQKRFIAVNMAAHPTCYGPKQRQLSSDFPYYICETLEQAGYNAAFFQGAQAAVATDRGKFIHEPVSRHQGIVLYGQAVAKFVLSAEDTAYRRVEPLLNVALRQTLIPVDNGLIALLGKLRLVNNNVTRVTFDEKKGKKSDLYIVTEVGLAEFGNELKFALIPGELMPELAFGGLPDAKDSYNSADYPYPPLCEMVSGRLRVIGLCNDCVAYIVPDNDFGSMFAPLHYEEAVSPGHRTASNISGAFRRLAETAEKLRAPSAAGNFTEQQ